MKQIKTSEDAYQLIRPLLEGEEQENLIMLSLNSAGIVKNIDWLSFGSDTQTIMSSKQIARQAILNNAVGVILSHNHPSGRTRPSIADDENTKRVKEALELVEIRLMDHLIIGDANNRFFSYSDNGKF